MWKENFKNDIYSIAAVRDFEYALRSSNKPIDVSEYKLTHRLPEKLKGKIPTSKELKQMLTKAIPNAEDIDK